MSTYSRTARAAGADPPGSQTALGVPGSDAGPDAASVVTTVTSAATTSARGRSRPGGLSRGGWMRVVSPVAAVGLWQLASSTGLLPESKLASPVSVAHTARRGRLLVVGQLFERGTGCQQRRGSRPVQGHAQHRRPEGHRRPGPSQGGRPAGHSAVQGDVATFTSGPPMLQAMGTSAVDIGGVGDAPPVFAASGGENVVIVGARKTDFDRDAVVVPKGSPITSIQQLKGKKIAYGSGSSANYNLLTVLGKAGLSIKDVNLVSLQPAPALAAFTSGAVDAWDIWPPYVQQVVAQNGARILASGPQYGSPYSFQVAAKSALSDPAKSAAIKSYLTILNKAYLWAGRHPQAWATAWAAASGLPADVMLQAAKVSATTPVPITAAIIKSEQNLVDQFFAAGLIPAKVDISAYVTDQFNGTVPAA